MKVNVSVNFNKNKALEVRGLGNSKKARKFLASEVVRLADPYVPMQQGALKNQRTIAADGSEVAYTQPYAHYHYYGEAMGGRAPKAYTGKKLTYSGAPMRGKKWIPRMLADKRKELESGVERFVDKGGKG